MCALIWAPTTLRTEIIPIPRLASPPRPPLRPPQTYILDGNLYDGKFLEGGSKALMETGTETMEELEACALLLNKKKVGEGGAVIGEGTFTSYNEGAGWVIH